MNSLKISFWNMLKTWNVIFQKWTSSVSSFPPFLGVDPEWIFTNIVCTHLSVWHQLHIQRIKFPVECPIIGKYWSANSETLLINKGEGKKKVCTGTHKDRRSPNDDKKPHDKIIYIFHNTSNCSFMTGSMAAISFNNIDWWTSWTFCKKNTGTGSIKW